MGGSGSGIAIFYKKKKFKCQEAKQQPFKPGMPWIIAQCLFSLKDDPSFEFVFCETQFPKEF